jgi:release factor glutamine methyltransferase
VSSFDAQCLALDARLKTLPDKPEETARATLAALWHLAAGTALSVQAAQERVLPMLDSAGESRLQQFIARRLSGEPLAYITGRQRFLGLEMLADRAALIPRQETELLAGTAIAAGRALLPLRPKPLVMDVCTGSGNVALALAVALPSATVCAADLSAEAVDLARRNAVLLGLADRVDFKVGDLLAPFGDAAFAGRVDLLTCNPPYISTSRLQTMPGEIAAHEPAMAFDGGPLGIRILQRLIREAPAVLADGGCLVFEVGRGQGPAVVKRLEQSGAYEGVRGELDDHGEMRTLLAYRRKREIQ